MNVRRQVRDAFVAGLTGLTTTADRVYNSRVQRLEGAMVPGLVVATTEAEQDLSSGSMSAPEYWWSLTVLVTGGCAELTEELVIDKLDLIASEVEVAVAGLSLNDSVTSITPLQVEYDLQAQQQMMQGTIAITYAVQYTTARGAPDVFT